MTYRVDAARRRCKPLRRRQQIVHRISRQRPDRPQDRFRRHGRNAGEDFGDRARSARHGVAQTKVHLELQLATYLSATAVVEGGDTPNRASPIRRSRARHRGRHGPVVAQLTPPDAGIYRIRATIAGASNDAMETDVQIT